MFAGRLIRFLTGHNFTRRHNMIVNKFHQAVGWCRFCRDTEEDPFHIIKRCPEFSHIRKKIFGKTELTWELLSWEAIHRMISRDEIRIMEENINDL